MGDAERSMRGLGDFERWTDRQISEAMAEGRFDDLPGAGRPLPDLDEPHDDLWWVRKKLAEEDVAVLPPSLLLRREVEQLLARAGAAATEAEVTALVEQANTKIRRANRLGVMGPPHNLVPYDVAAFVQRWRDASPPAPPPPVVDDHAPAAEAPAPETPAAARRRRWGRPRRTRP